ncbi:MAG: hypothetical protein P8Z31_07510, partial [Gammaproteobacteria bacterium]
VEDKSDIKELQDMISKHLMYTQSTVASKILTNWEAYLPMFVKVIPASPRKCFLHKYRTRKVFLILYRQLPGNPANPHP